MDLLEVTLLVARCRSTSPRTTAPSGGKSAKDSAGVSGPPIPEALGNLKYVLKYVLSADKLLFS